MNQPTSASELYDMFVAPGVPTEDIAAMDIKTMARQVEELRAEKPDYINLCNRAIAYLILTHADSCERGEEDGQAD